ncbi:hypothetical protein CCACVL1_27172 [Corchorus capsularis]|uniref:Uncharacterized protein n=1 Tax=Corchorus capsularis TaxID=210143 RepID=A0A1R3GBY7_COCAP|nr:hypothetical protein CCACVL1_27172 [Corchorus capsularis]
MALTVSLSPPPYTSKSKNPPIFYIHPCLIKSSQRISKLGPTPILCTATPSSSNHLKTCKNCKTQFDPLLNHPRACRFHTAHFGGETKRKFESVYAGGTMDTPDSGKVFQYWHCCGSEDPFDPGCTAAPHASYDD